MAKKQKPSASKAATAAAEEGKKRKEEPKKEPEESESEEESEEEEEESEEEAESEEEEEEAESEEEEEEENEDEEEEEEDEASKKETLRKLLEPFSKEQMIDFLKDAALKDRKILSRITERADTDPVHRKIFIHGLGWDATTEQVLNVFKPYGEIQECKVVTDKLTGRAKGYGFVLFATRKSAKKALKQPQKKIGNRMTSSQLASAGPVNASGGKTGNAGLQAANSGSAPGLALQQQQQPKQPELGMSYVSPGLYVPAAAAPGIMVGQNAGIGLANPLLLSGIGTTVTPQSLGISGTYGNVNSVSPSVISNYSQLGLQGLGAYSQNQSQSPASGGAGAAIGGAGAASRQQSGYGSVGTSYSSYFGNR